MDILPHDPHQHPSPFLSDAHDFTSPTPSSGFLAASPNSPFDSFEFNQASPRIPLTPSYNGSYNGSPYTTYSDLSYTGPDASEPLGLFDGEDSAGYRPDEYDPSAYDLPNQPSGLLMFDTHFMDGVHHSNPQLQLAITPPAEDVHDHPSPYDHSSPASSAGGGDARSIRSRASSLSSNHAGSMVGSPPTHQFEALHFAGEALSPREKPQSPPRLVIVESAASGTLSPPAINAPEGDGTLGAGPSLNVVPATPISGGGAATAAPSFQQTLETMHQQQSGPSVQQGWAAQPTDQSMSFTFPPETSSAPDPSQMYTHGGAPDFLFPAGMQRAQRSKSDTNSRPPQAALWGLSAPDSSALLDDASLISMNDMNFPDPNQPHPSAPQHARPPHLSHNYTFGPPSSTSAHLGAPSSNGPSPSVSPALSANLSLYPHEGGSASAGLGQFLSPSDALAGAQLRRSISENSGRPSHRRQWRSEDMRGAPSSYGFAPHQGGAFFHGGGGAGGAPQYGDVLPVPSITQRGHHRRASSGSRSERGVGMFPGPQPGGGLMPGGAMHGSMSARTSPYPSPRVSPRNEYEALPPDVWLTAGGAARRASAAGLGIPGLPGADGGAMGSGGGVNPHATTVDAHGADGLPVQKANVTTHATKDASEKRRKVDANFVCPVPGCGSTFTRHFNLKGHLRSHNEEKPYQCKWPGCNKSFARQHDCKRHENLHLNIRPFTCDGCKKTFARMDALNRHLKSEGGVECQKVQQELTAGAYDDFGQPIPPNHHHHLQQQGVQLTKPESDISHWPGQGGMMM